MMILREMPKDLRSSSIRRKQATKRAATIQAWKKVNYRRNLKTKSAAIKTGSNPLRGLNTAAKTPK